MENQNTGSFGAAIGGGSALAEAMQRRGMNPGVLNQVSPAAPTAPNRLPPQPVPTGSPSAVPQQRPQQSGLGQPPTPKESEIIVKSLSQRLKTLGELTEKGFQV